MQDLKLKLEGREDRNHKLKIEGLPAAPREITTLRPRLAQSAAVARSGPRMDDMGPAKPSDTIAVHTSDDISIEILVNAVTSEGGFAGTVVRFNSPRPLLDVEGIRRGESVVTPSERFIETISRG